MAAKISTPQPVEEHYRALRQEIYALAIAHNFFSAIFHRRVCFLNLDFCCDFDLN
ncbi:MAG: hypothetical protein M3R36_10880 [Bacteroidota bacterium]|nr:hypothetical protein [Bacteroidota bacterium]